MIRAPKVRAMIELIKAKGQASSNELAAAAGVDVGEVSCRLTNHVRNGTLRIIRKGVARWKETIYGIGDGTKIEFQRPRSAEGQTCDCGQPAVVWKSGAKICAGCDKKQKINYESGVMRAPRIRLFGADRSCDKYREQRFWTTGGVSRLVNTFPL